MAAMESNTTSAHPPFYNSDRTLHCTFARVEGSSSGRVGDVTNGYARVYGQGYGASVSWPSREAFSLELSIHMGKVIYPDEVES